MRVIAEGSTNRRTTALVIATLLVTGVAIWLFLPRGESLHDAALRALQCVKSGDANCLFDLTRQEEAEVCGLTPQRLQACMAAVGNDFDYKSQGQPPSFFDPPDLGMTTVVEEGRLPDGTGLQLTVNVVATDDGPKLVSFMEGIMPRLVANHWPKDVQLPRKEMLELARLRGVRSIGPQFEQIGVKGFQRGKPGSGLYTWREFEDRTEAVLRKLGTPEEALKN